MRRPRTTGSMQYVLIQLRPLSLLLFPNQDLSVVGAAGEDGAKLRMSPCDLPDWTSVATGYVLNKIHA